MTQSLCICICISVHIRVRTDNILYVACIFVNRRGIIKKFLLDPMQQAEKQKKIGELTAELEATNQRCEVYRANLLTVLKDMEEQKLKLSVKVQNARLSLKE